jgi:hypothetical protein
MLVPLNIFRNLAISEWLVGFRFLNYLLRKQDSSFCKEILLHLFSFFFNFIAVVIYK